MTPIFLSDTSHRYNIFDYYAADPILGTLKELCALCGRQAACNTSGEAADSMLPLPDGFRTWDAWMDHMSGEKLSVTGGAAHVKLAPGQGNILLRII